MASFRSTVENMSKLMDEMGITELDLERQLLLGLYRKHIHLSKQQTVAAPSAGFVQQSKAHSDDKISGHALKSPMVGVLYLAPEPGAKPFVKVGSTVKAGDTVALVEAMKTFNPVVADAAGKIKAVLVESGAPVEYQQPLFEME